MNKGNHNVRAAPSTWLMAVMAMLSLSSAADSLVGVGLRETSDFTGYDRLSLMGGAKMLVKSSAVLNNQAGSNYLKYHNWQVQGGIPPLLGPGLSRTSHQNYPSLLSHAAFNLKQFKFCGLKPRVFLFLCYALYDREFEL